MTSKKYQKENNYDVVGPGSRFCDGGCFVFPPKNAVCAVTQNNSVIRALERQKVVKITSVGEMSYMTSGNIQSHV